MTLSENLHYSYADLITEIDTPMELIQGQIFNLASPSIEHQKTVGAIFAQLYTFFKNKRCKVFCAPTDVRLFEVEDDNPENVDTVVVPDIIVVCDENKIDKAGCKGAPDLIVEVLSPSTQQRDRIAKFNLYQEAGVREYWIVDPDAKTVQTFVLTDKHYKAKALGLATDTLEADCLQGCVINLGEVFEQEEQ